MGPYILLVEDDPSIARLLELTLRSLTPKIVHRDNGQDALMLLDSETPDLIILDISMPVMTGWQFLELMQEDPDRRGIPVIILTAHNDSVNRMTGQLEGVHAYLTKPVMPQRLREEVNKVLMS
jgi:CheY-like chemotaxis protein